MASFSQSPPCFSAPINRKIHSFSYNPAHPNSYSSFLNPNSATVRISCSTSESNPPQESSPSPEVSRDPIKLAFAKAKAYKNSSNPNADIAPKSQQGRATPYVTKEEKGKNLDGGDSKSNGPLEENEAPMGVKAAMEKAEEYKKSIEVVENDGEAKEVPLALKLALEKAKEYKNRGSVETDKDRDVRSEVSGSKKIPTEPGECLEKNEELKISNIDFVGLNFSDKKTGRSLPAGLVPISDPFPEGELPEVEIIVGDKSRFKSSVEESASIAIEEEEDDLYKPKVSTWGVFPRPNNISRTYGGGRNLHPGEELETAEEKAAKEKRTKQLVAAYKSKIGMNIEPKLKAECEKALKEGESLMDLGKLKEAIPFYEKVMEKLAFQSELHGLAALQWSICQDSLSKSKEARVMYEKLQSHPSPQVSKKARQFYFSFQAMEMMKVTSLKRSTRSTGYQNYFDAFLRDKTNFSSGKEEQDEGMLSQALPYFVLLVSPIFMVLLIAATRP